MLFGQSGTRNRHGTCESARRTLSTTLVVIGSYAALSAPAITNLRDTKEPFTSVHPSPMLTPSDTRMPATGISSTLYNIEVEEEHLSLPYSGRIRRHYSPDRH